jgi:hypothetical protein
MKCKDSEFITSFCSLNFTLHVTQISDNVARTCTQSYVFLRKGLSKLLPVVRKRALFSATSNWVRDRKHLSRSARNVCRSYQDATDENVNVATKYFRSIRVFLMHLHTRKSGGLRSGERGGQAISFPRTIHESGNGSLIQLHT